MEQYLSIAVFLIFSLIFAAILIGTGYLVSPKKPNAEKLSPYESGFEAFEDARLKFDVRFYLVAILFIVFDLELVFMIPWAVYFKSMAGPGIIAGLLFLFILVVGFAYEWKKGALEWD